MEKAMEQRSVRIARMIVAGNAVGLRFTLDKNNRQFSLQALFPIDIVAHGVADDAINRLKSIANSVSTVGKKLFPIIKKAFPDAVFYSDSFKVSLGTNVPGSSAQMYLGGYLGRDSLSGEDLESLKKIVKNFSVQFVEK